MMSVKAATAFERYVNKNVVIANGSENVLCCGRVIFAVVALFHLVRILEFFWRSATMASTARSTPRLRSIGFIPAATALVPSLTIVKTSDQAGDGTTTATVLAHAKRSPRSELSLPMAMQRLVVSLPMR